MKEEVRDLYEYLAFKYAVAYLSAKIIEAFELDKNANLTEATFFDKLLIRKMAEIQGVKLK